MPKPMQMHSLLLSNNKNKQDEEEEEPCFMLLLKASLFGFWKQQMEEILAAPDLKRKQELPLARVRRAIKSNDQVTKVSAHSTVLFAKASEMFILELTLRAWMQAEQVKRRTLQRYDIARAIRNDELLDFLCDMVPLQSYKVREEANYGRGNEFHPAYQMVQPNNIPVEVGEKGGQGNEFHPAYQMVQPNNIPVEEEAKHGQGKEFHLAYQRVQPDNFPVEKETRDGQGNGFPAYQLVQPNNILRTKATEFQVEEETKGGQGNEFYPAYQMVQPNNIPVEEETKDGQGKEFLQAYQMVQRNNIPVEEETKYGQGNEFHQAYKMVQPNNIPASFINLQGIPAQLMLPPLFNSSPEVDFASDGIMFHKKERL